MDMKLILALILCGVAYAIASPTCSESELEKCSSYNPKTDDEDYMVTEEYLNGVCKSTGCMKDYKGRCGVESLDKYWKSRFMVSEKVYRGLCDTDSQALRRKYSDNIKCINRVTSYAKDECFPGEVIELEHTEFCKREKVFMDCVYDLFGRDCGNDAREVYVAITPGLEYHGCKE